MNTKVFIYSVMYTVLALIMLVALYFGYLWATYIDDTIKSGYGYGFSIGDGKDITYKKAPSALAKLRGHNSLVFIEIRSESDIAKELAADPGHIVMVEALLHGIGYSKFKIKNEWDFYINGSYFNKLSLKFCDEKLCEIYRHRKYFELP